ncbi:MAG: hypothetical protein J6S67_17610 [Methanobrevibacter sp.]|nr:hypothetical protein [Methanobrevibacter sp.]
MMEKDLIQERNAQIQALADQLVRTKTVFDLATELATYMIKERERPISKIPVTESEYQQIINLFRVKGVRPDGTAETRGRRRIDSD